MIEETITRYVAEDGKVFDDAYECREYEGSLHAHDVSFFKYCGDVIKKMLPTISDCVSSCEIIVIKTIDGAKWVQESCNEWGIKSPFDNGREFKTGIFIYNEYEDDWDDWEEYFKRMTVKNEEMLKLRNR